MRLRQSLPSLLHPVLPVSVSLVPSIVRGNAADPNGVKPLDHPRQRPSLSNETVADLPTPILRRMLNESIGKKIVKLQCNMFPQFRAEL